MFRKNLITPILMGLCIPLFINGYSPICAKAAETTSNQITDVTWESEHPPLSDNTKKAIADYKKNPTEENKQAILNALNETYDWVIENKKNNLEKYTQERENKISLWMRAVLNGNMPPFMSLSTDNNKGEEREAVGNAIAIYRANMCAETKQMVKDSLENYYDVFLQEQQEHIIDTENTRETRIQTALLYFTSDLFSPSKGVTTELASDDVLAEIICQYISAGAEIVPVNPEARVREREYNANITNAQIEYVNNPTQQNYNVLQQEVTKAFQSALDVRIEETDLAKEKGCDGALALIENIYDSEFVNSQYEELIQQRNLYGRIDRIVTFGSNTYGNWTPRMIEQSHELANLLSIYKLNASEENKSAVETKFYEIYNNMLELETTNLENTKLTLSSYIMDIMTELTSTVDNKSYSTNTTLPNSTLKKANSK